MSQSLLSVRDLGWDKAPGLPIFDSVNFTVQEGDFVTLTGKSGCGKSTLLKCLAHLNLYKGDVLFRGQTPKSMGVPKYRTHVLYVPQRPALLPGTPRDFLNKIHEFASRQTENGSASSLNDSISTATSIAEEWGIEEELWDRTWASLSGGESQRIALSIAVGIRGAEVLLLDEPTSALDGGSVKLVEKVLKDLPHSDRSTVKAIICVTHSPEQAGRLGTRSFEIEHGRLHETQLV